MFIRIKQKNVIIHPELLSYEARGIALILIGNRDFTIQKYLYNMFKI